MAMKKNVVVIGGAGHVGLPFSIVVANTTKFNVVGIDLDEKKCDRLNKGEMIYIEEDGQGALREAIAFNNLKFSTDKDNVYLDEADVIAIMIGTPVDSENNPRLDDIMNYFRNVLIPSLLRNTKERLILLRSTVNPGTTELLREIIEDTLADVDHIDRIHLVFAPERVAQGFGIRETGKLPQLIGCSSIGNSFEKAKEFFDTFVDAEYGCIDLTYREAEMAKLVTNMTRYVSFALANEFYMIADNLSDMSDPININRVIDACNYKYPRMNLPKPGPNVGGPCLFKDGRFLTAGIPYNDLINTAFSINEGFVHYLFNKLERQLQGHERNVTILGMTFKAESDDIRNSLSFKLAKIAKHKGYKVTMCDPLWNDGDPRNTDFKTAMDSAEIVFVMTPHTIFKQLLENYSGGEKGKWFIDVWKKFQFDRTEESGFEPNDGFDFVYFR